MASSDAQDTSTAKSAWRTLAPLPDPVGFGGMFGGVLEGRLVAGGGSQFREKPAWLKGEKSFSDRVFMLASPEENWTELAFRLPDKLGHFATATTLDAIYLVGGMGATGCVAHTCRLASLRGELRLERLPDFPHPIANAAAAIAQQRLFVIGGLERPTANAASAEVWSLDIATSAGRAEWRRESDLPVGIFIASAAAIGPSVFVFGGMAFDALGKFSPSAAAFCLDINVKRWDRLPDLPEARVGAATPAAVLPGKRILVAGGYATVFSGEPRNHPGFSAGTLIYDSIDQTWALGPGLPRHPVADRDAPGDRASAPMIVAPCVVWRDMVVIVSGEVRASVRTPAVVAWNLTAVNGTGSAEGGRGL